MNGKEEDRLERLREIMKTSNVDGYLVPHEDSHFSEFLSPGDKRLEFISNFSGSAGFCVIGREQAILCSDSRYTLQANRELDTLKWKYGLCRKFSGPEVCEFVKENFEAGSKIGVDPFLISVNDFKSFQAMLSQHQIELVSVRPNLIDLIWTSKPKIEGHIVIHEEKYCGESSSNKLRRIREKMKEDGAGVLVVTSLDEIAWTTNLRGKNMIPFCGTFPSWLIIYEDEAILYVDRKHMKEEERTLRILGKKGTRTISSLDDSSIQVPNFIVKDYNDFQTDIKSFRTTSFKVMIDPGHFCHFFSSFFAPEHLILKDSPIKRMKMVKNYVEIRGFERALERDCAALVHFYRWLERTLETNPSSDDLLEYNASMKLEEFRRKLFGSLFFGNAFETICSVGSNAAVVHYHPKEDSPRMKKINLNEVLLLDSGGHYVDGSTDTTRTRHFGTPTPETRKYYTHALKGHMLFASLVLPERMNSAYTLHLIPRIPLLKIGYDYPHGSSHGVGTCLNVHEEPYLSGKYKPCLNSIFTIEPGCYFENKNLGIRIENMYHLKRHETLINFMELECLTYFPFQRKMIEKKFLNNEEIEWVDRYHAKCRERLLPYFEEDQESKNWILKETEKL